jgi:hypothetical protein
VAVPADFRDSYEAFAQGPAKLRAAISELTMGELTRRADGSGWSVRDVLVHLSDAELVRSVRIRLILAEERPALFDFDEGTWQRRLQYLWRSPEAALAQFEQARFSTAEILAHCGREAWTRAGVHPTDGDLTVAELVRRGVVHVDDHTAQIAGIRAAKR